MLWLKVFLAFASICLSAQDSRTGRIEAARDAKAAALKPEETTKAEDFARRFKDDRLMERVFGGMNGFRPKIGNMVTGGGFAGGVEYLRDDLLQGQLTARASAQLSTQAFQKYEMQATLPRLVKERLAIDLISSYRNYAGLNFYGQGPDSRRTGRSNYRMEDTSFDAIAGFSPTRFWKVGAGSGLLFTNVGPGNNRRLISAEKQFNAPGLSEQTDFGRFSVFTQVDLRDNPSGPKRGGNYVFQHSWYQDRHLRRFDFRRMDIDLEQHIPFLNATRRIVLRAKGTFMETDGNKEIPFYLQPIVGGSDDLRGYRFFRFTDRNAVVYNAEYRWEVFSGLDGALFFDAGKVMPRRGMLAFSELETSAGFGLRFNAQNVTAVRIDVGFSREGFQIWFKFNDLLNNRKFGTNTLQPAY